MFKLQYTNAALGTLIAQGASFFKRIFWKAFPLACVIAFISFAISFARLVGRDYISFGFAWLLLIHRVLGAFTLLFVGLLIFVFACYFSGVLMYRMYGSTQEGQVPSIGKSFSAVWAKSLKAATALFLCVILLVLAILILVIIFSILNVFLKSYLIMVFACVLLAILAVVWGIFISLIIPVAIFENAGIFRTIGRSIRLVSRGFWKTFVVLLIAKLPSIIAYYLLILIALLSVGSLAEFQAYAMMHGPLMVMGVIQIVWLLVSPFLFIWSISYLLNLYHTLKNLDESLKRS